MGLHSGKQRRFFVLLALLLRTYSLAKALSYLAHVSSTCLEKLFAAPSMMFVRGVGKCMRSVGGCWTRAQSIMSLCSEHERTDGTSS